MAIGTYSELKTSVAAWLNRTDLTSVLGDFVALAESDIRNDVRVRAMEEFTTSTLSGATLDAPTGFLSARRLTLNGRKVEYRTPEQYADITYAGASGYVFTSIGQTLYILNGQSGDDYTLIYDKAFDALDADADTNWLLTNAPDVYLWGACKHGALYMMDMEKAAIFEGRYSASVGRLNLRESTAKVSGSALAQFPAAAA